MKRFVISLIYLYRWLISPFLPPSCRFTPTCSRYAISAIECHGMIKGLWMTIKRLLKCNPFHKADSPYDPVPLAKDPSSFISFPNSKPQSTDPIQPANSGYSQKLKRVHHA